MAIKEEFVPDGHGPNSGAVRKVPRKPLGQPEQPPMPQPQFVPQPYVPPGMKLVPDERGLSPDVVPHRRERQPKRRTHELKPFWWSWETGLLIIIIVLVAMVWTGKLEDILGVIFSD